ncbi:alpha/beta hydrolase [Actinomadura sp. SCN-SB]|uniref:alpha/beta hydrolase n=1 Tax=Actinomadura sp. SCN-SB TaxID=3373092 RepID=UPI003750348F
MGRVLLLVALVGGGTAMPVAAGTRAAFMPSDSGARITAETWQSATQMDITVQSPALGRSVKVRILLPVDWQSGTTRTWPVLYAYHGGRDDYTSWTRNTDIEAWAAEYDAIVVMPEASNGGFTDWYNYGLGGRPKWQTFHTQEVMQLVERNYHASTTRAAIGNSAGGQGAVTYAALFPGMFTHVASLSGVLSLRMPGMPSLIVLTNSINGQDPMGMYGIPVLHDANWRKRDPLELAAALRGTKVFFSSGTTGQPGPGDPPSDSWDIGLIGEEVVGRTNVAFRDRLDQLGVPYTADLYGDGRHNWPAWIRVGTAIWPDLMASIGARRV